MFVMSFFCVFGGVFACFVCNFCCRARLHFGNSIAAAAAATQTADLLCSVDCGGMRASHIICITHSTIRARCGGVIVV